MTALATLFDPRSVAVVGASPDERKFSSRPVNFLRRGFGGAIYPVNPRHETIEGLACYPSIAALPETPDVAYVMVPSHKVRDVIEACGARRVPFAVVSTSGYAETPDGKVMQQDLKEVAEAGDVRLLGPNCEGIWNVREGLYLTFGSAAARPDLHAGTVSIVGQSGSVASGIAQRLLDEGCGIDLFATTGNEVDVDLVEIIEYLVERPTTDVIGMFIEGVRDGRRLVEVGRRALRAKVPIVALRAGITESGQQAIATHTGKTVSSDDVYDGVFRQGGILRVGTVAEMVEALIAFRGRRSLPERGPAIVSISGGSRALFADAAAEVNLSLPAFGQATIAAIAELLPAYATTANPADITGEPQSNSALMTSIASAVGSDGAVGSLIVQMAAQGKIRAPELGPDLGALAESLGKPIIMSFIAGLPDREDRIGLRAAGLMLAAEPAAAIRALASFRDYQGFRGLARRKMGRYRRKSGQIRPTGDHWAWLAASGIPIVRRQVARTHRQLDAALDEVGLPAVLKLSADEFPHKTELGGVRFVRTRTEAHSILRQWRVEVPTMRELDVQELVTGALEIIVSARDNPDVGPTLHVGLGGVFVELIAKFASRVLPVGPEDVADMLSDAGITPLMLGYRGMPPRDTAALVDCILRVADLFVGPAPMSELELNPVMVGQKGQGVRVVDMTLRFTDE